MPACRSCELIERRDRGGAPRWDQIVRTPHWDVVHAYGTSIEGWLVLVARRHITAVAELTDDEAGELGPLVRDVSQALHAALGCPKTYVAQFAEAADHPHVHFHVIARAADQPDEWRGPRIFSQLGGPESAAVNEARMDEIADLVRPQLDRWRPA